MLLATFGEALRRDENITASVYVMRPDATGTRRISPEDGSIENFQQGRTELSSGAVSYPGDNTFRAANHVSMQVHQYDLLYPNSTDIIAKGAPLITIYVPPALAKDWLIQVQQGQ